MCDWIPIECNINGFSFQHIIELHSLLSCSGRLFELLQMLDVTYLISCKHNHNRDAILLVIEFVCLNYYKPKDCWPIYVFSQQLYVKQVSHHPTVVACHCQGRGWKFWADSNIRSKFWGRSIQLDPVGVLTLEFDDGEIFQWSKVRIMNDPVCMVYYTVHLFWLFGFSIQSYIIHLFL